MDLCKTSIVRKLDLKDRKGDMPFTVKDKVFWDFNLIGDPHLYFATGCLLILGK